MTINYGPRCTCGQPQWTTAPYPCPYHGHGRSVTFPTYRVCQGRHCAHDYQCHHWTYTTNGA